MSLRELHRTLRAFTEEAALTLEHDVQRGAEVPYEVVEAPGGSAALYVYEPLSAEFVRARMGVLGRLPSYPPAAAAMGRADGVERYLQARGEPRLPKDAGERIDAALRSFLASVFAGTSEFAFQPERFARAYAELERLVFAGRSETVVAVPVHGLAIASERMDIADGLALVQAQALPDAPPDALAPLGGRSPLLAVLTAETEPGDATPLRDARRRCARLLTALRLFDAGAFALGAAGWVRTDGGPWRLLTIGGVGRAAGPPLELPPEQEDELRAFCNLIARRVPRSGEIAWALARYEMGCERRTISEALSDHLLALRALLEPEGPSSGRLAGRLAAICAVPERRGALAERVAHAISLERAVIAGLAPADPGAADLVLELADHLRAVLRDVLCGHLDSDVRTVADDLIAASLEAEAQADAQAPDRRVPGAGRPGGAGAPVPSSGADTAADDADAFAGAVF